MAKTGVIGAGSWGTALALVLHNNGHEVTLWSHSAASVESLLKNRELKDKLPGVKIPEAIQITNDLQQAVRNMDMLVLAVPSACIRSTAHNMAPCVADGQLIVCVSKGIEESTLKIMTEVIEDEIPNCRAAVLSGPSHAEEVSRGLPTTVVAGAHDRETAEYIQNLFMNQVFRVYTSPDMLGIELGGALKNVIALAAGIADGLGYGDNTKAALITRGIAEMSRIGIAMGGLGSDAAIEAADIVLMDDQPTKIAAAIRIARKTVRIVRENIVFALTVKAIVLVMGALGKAPMWLAVFADVGVAFLAILNAMRCLYTEKDKK